MGVDPWVIEQQRRFEAAQVARGVPRDGNPSRPALGVPELLRRLGQTMAQAPEPAQNIRMGVRPRLVLIDSRS